MTLDRVSKNIVTLALFLNKRTPGLVSEIWIDKKDQADIEESLESIDINKVLDTTEKEIEEVTDDQRKNYLKEIFKSLKFQIENADFGNVVLNNFYINTYGIALQRVTEDELENQNVFIKKLEKECGSHRFEIIDSAGVKRENMENEFETNIKLAEEILPKFLTNIPNSKFEIEIIDEAPWGAFNSHVAPYTSKLTVNASTKPTKFDFYHFAFHEMYGGHHSELSLKDQLLVNEGKGEHGLVIVYSPQVFISEAIAETAMDTFGISKRFSKEEKVYFEYLKLVFMAHNAATFMYFDDKTPKEKIEEYLGKFDLGSVGIKNIMGFSTDVLYGRYAAIYYPAYKFLTAVLEKTNDRDTLLKKLYYTPCTPSIIFESV